MHFATFFLSTGRCGTQWLAKHLSESYGGSAVVEHEPLYMNYYPKQLLSLDEPSKSKNGQGFLDHVKHIESVLETKNYIECGWPCYGALRYFADKFSGRIKIVHLTRHPVPTACSMVTHKYYNSPPRDDEIDDKALLTPFDRGVIFPEIGVLWETMSRMEKCLYFWAEINAFGLRLESELEVPWLRLKMEALFQADGLDKLLDFLEFSATDRIYGARDERTDSYNVKTKEELRARIIEHHPQFMDVAGKLNYDTRDVDMQALGRRYVRMTPESPKTN